MSIELILLSVNLNLVAFSARLDDLTGQIFAMFILTVAASEAASFAESFVRVGLIPGDGGAWLLPRVVGMSKACEMSFTGEAVDAAEALRCGLVSRVVPADELMSAAHDLAGRIAANPGVGLRMSKRLLREGQHMRLESLLEMSAAFQAVAHKTPQHVEAINAFVEKRKPNFTEG